MLPPESSSASQNLHTAVVAGARIRVRGSSWRVRHVQPFDACTVVHLIGTGADNAGQRRTLLDPFDRLQPDAPRTTLRVVRPRRWYHAFRRLLAADHPHDGLWAAASARIELLPHQLEPALAIVRGQTCRVLLADEVGLGKTIQAGLILAELRERGLSERTLILSPSGLRRQWQTELADRFSIPATVVDRSLLRRRASVLPAGTNPWLMDEVAIASIDLIKRPEALRGLTSIVWDLLIVDEAHVVAQAARRHAAAEVLGQRARRVVLLTATPHAGDEGAFSSLCGIGAAGDALMAMFRRTRRQAGLAVVRRVRTLGVKLGAAEADLHRHLNRYASAVLASPFGREAVLAMVVLIKRALSGSVPLRVSLERRLAMLEALEGADGGGNAASQMSLPMTEEAEDEHDDRDLVPSGLLGASGLADRTREVELLRTLVKAARVVGVGRKAQVLTRLLARLNEPVIVFTEYRDTLEHLATLLEPTARIAVIHGGLREQERLQAQAAFTTGAADVLLATDAAGEGLNLHARCRLVINLELPWNPMRLEQRIGRVDRLGQRRHVHAINLLASDTAELLVLGRLVRRLERARQRIDGISDPLGISDELARAMLTADVDRSEPPDRLAWRPDLRRAAETEVERLRALRTLAPQNDSGRDDPVLITVRPPARVRGLPPPPSIVWLMRVCLIDGNGQLVERRLVTLLDRSTAHAGRALRRPRSLRTALQTALGVAGPSLTGLALDVARSRLGTAIETRRLATKAARLRERRLTETIRADRSVEPLFQAGLFDGRDTRRRDAAAAARTHLLELEAERLRRLAAAGDVSVGPDPELVLVLVVSDT